MEKLKKHADIFWFHITINVIVVFFITGASYYHTPLQGGKDSFFYLIHLFLLQTTVAGGIYFLSLWRWVFYVVFPVLFLALSVFAFFGYTQDVSITSGLIQAIFESKSDIIFDLFSLPFVLFLLTVIFIIYFIIKWYKKITPTKGATIGAFISIACIALYFIVENKRLNTFKSRLPYNVYSGIQSYLKTPDIVLNNSPLRVSKVTDSLKVLFVLGETVRADHLQLNGYNRKTTPLLSAREDIISWKKLYTSNTYTASSLPQILTDKNLGEVKDKYRSIYSVANEAKIATTWVGNQSLEISFEPIVRTNNEVYLIDAFKSEYSFNKELDGAMLPVLDTLLPKQTSQLFTLHMIGSHWYYENRYPETLRKFTPVIDSKYIPSLTNEQLVNSYDNTLLYLDYFLNQTIQRLSLEDVPTALVYVSDHGENLGEEGKYLHADGGDAVKNPAAIFWFSPSYIEQFPDVLEKISSQSEKKITTNVIFKILVEILRITSYEPY